MKKRNFLKIICSLLLCLTVGFMFMGCDVNGGDNANQTQNIVNSEDVLKFTSITNGYRIDGLNVYGKSLSNIQIEISRIHNSLLVTEINESAFEGCRNIVGVTIANSIKKIGKNAFKNCEFLKSVEFEENSSFEEFGGSVVYYGGAFAECSRLKSINLPEGLLTLTATTFQHCSSLKRIVIPKSLQNIGRNAFDGCSKLEEVIIASDSSLVSMDNYAFSSCNKLAEITLPKFLTNIGSNCFAGCISLDTVNNYSNLELVRGSMDNGMVAYFATTINNFDI